MVKISSCITLSKLLLLAVLILPGFIQAQDYSLIESINAKNPSITTDYLVNLYVISEFRLSKYDKEGKFLQVYEDYTNGTITSIDVSDPMKIIVFYEDFLRVKVLDHTLSEIAAYDFNTGAYSTISALAHSRDDDFWIFDNTSFLLKKINENGKAIYLSEKFNMLFTETVQPIQIIDYKDLIYLNDPNHGIYVFDRFATYKKRIPILGADRIQIMQDVIVFFKDEALKSYRLVDFLEESMQLPEGVKARHVQLQKDRLYIADSKKVFIFSYK